MTRFPRSARSAAHHYPWLPVSLVLRDRWDNAAARPRKYHGPVAIMVAGEDEVVTPGQSRKLFELADPKRRWVDADATHNTVVNDAAEPWWHEVSDFLLNDTRPRVSSP